MSPPTSAPTPGVNPSTGDKAVNRHATPKGPKAPANVLVFGTSPLRVIPVPPISPTLPVSNPRALDSSDSPARLSALRSFARVASSAPRAKSGSKTPRCASVVICKS